MDIFETRSKSAFGLGINESVKKPLISFEHEKQRLEKTKADPEKMFVKKEQAKSFLSRKSAQMLDDRLNNKLAFLLKTYASNDDKDSIDFGGLGRMLCGVGVLKYITPDDLDVFGMLSSKIKMDAPRAREEVHTTNLV